MGPAVDQGKTPQCVCFSLSALKHHDEVRRCGSWLKFDPQPIYDQCKCRDGAPDEDGTTVRDAMKVAAKDGLMADDGQRRFVKGYARIETTDEIRHALSLRKAVMIGLHISNDALSSLGPAAVAGIPTETDGGHCMLAVGYDDDHRALRVRNSWGSEWADNGHFWLPYGYLHADPEFDAWTTVCEKVEGTKQDTASTPELHRENREVGSSNYAWFDPSDLTLSDDDGPLLEWKGISKDQARNTLEKIVVMRDFINLNLMKGCNHLATRESLSLLRNPDGEKRFHEDDLRDFDLYFGSDAIRIDGDGRGGFMVINGRHRLFMAQEMGIRSVPVSVSNLARKQIRSLIESGGS
jgi:hypothetical protein